MGYLGAVAFESVFRPQGGGAELMPMDVAHSCFVPGGGSEAEGGQLAFDFAGCFRYYRHVFRCADGVPRGPDWDPERAGCMSEETMNATAGMDP
jgi:hypothetical protein